MSRSDNVVSSGSTTQKLRSCVNNRHIQQRLSVGWLKTNNTEYQQQTCPCQKAEWVSLSCLYNKEFVQPLWTAETIHHSVLVCVFSFLFLC